MISIILCSNCHKKPKRNRWSDYCEDCTKLKNREAVERNNEKLRLKRTLAVGFNESILFYAFRYALGRKTYATKEVSDYLKQCWPILSQSTREIIKKEISIAIENNQAGMDCDIENWKKILDL